MTRDPVIFGVLLAMLGLMMASIFAQFSVIARFAKWLCHHHPDIWRELRRPGTTFFKGEPDNGYLSRTSALSGMQQLMPMLERHRKLTNDDGAQRYLRLHRWAGRCSVIFMALAAFVALLGVDRHKRRAANAGSNVGQSTQTAEVSRPDTSMPSKEIMKDEDPPEWRFPVEDFKIKEGFLCIARSKDLNWEYFDKKVEGEIVCTGFRLECAPVRVPGGAYGYKKEVTKKPEVMIDVVFPFESLARLEGATIPLGEPMETCGRELGSMYLFASHNEVRWQEIRFGKVDGDTIELEIDLFLDVDYDDGTTQFRHTLKGPAKIEQRWEP